MNNKSPIDDIRHSFPWSKVTLFCVTAKRFPVIFFVLPHAVVKHTRNRLKISVSMDVQPQLCGRTAIAAWTYSHSRVDVQPQNLWMNVHGNGGHQ